MKRESVNSVRNRADNSELCAPDEFVIADDKCRTEPCLFASLLRVKTDLYDIALF